MATNESSSLQGKNVFIDCGGTMTHQLTLAADIQNYLTVTGDGTTTLACLVPADGAELVQATFTPTSLGVGAHEQQWTISDGTNILATQATFTNPASLTVGTAATQTMGTATNGKNLATTAGARLTMTNTSRGTSTRGVQGIFRLVWAL